MTIFAMIINSISGEQLLTQKSILSLTRRTDYEPEIKRSSTISKKSLHGLRAFARDYPEAKLYMLYSGSLQQYYDDITVMPFEEALRELPRLLANKKVDK